MRARGGARLVLPKWNHAVQIEIVPCLSDNYAYLIKDGEYCAVLDPSEAAPVQAALDRLGLEASTISQHPSSSDHWAAIWR